MRISITTSKIWTPQGTVLSGGVDDENNNYNEPNVIYEGGVFKMWVHHGWNTSQLYYYTSNDGILWTPYGSNPLLSGAACVCPFVFKSGATYYLFFTPALNQSMQRWSSTDGTTWTQDSSAVLSLGSSGTWDDYQFGNMFVWKEGATDWRMLYEARGGEEAWKLGYATSSDGLSWTKSVSNPVISETGSIGGPFLYKSLGGTYYLWCQNSLVVTTPTDIDRYKSSNLTSWTKDPIGNNTLGRRGSDEGADNTNNGQVADICMLEIGGQTYAWFVANPNGNAVTGHAHIKLTISRLPMEQLILTNEGY